MSWPCIAVPFPGPRFGRDLLLQLGEERLKRAPKRFDLSWARELGPVRLDAVAGGHRNGPHGFATRSQEDESSAPVARVGATFDVAQLLEFLDGLRHRLLAYVRKLRELADLDALRGHECEDVRVRRANVAEPRIFQGRDNCLRPVLMNQPEEQAERGVRRNTVLHLVDRYLSSVL